MTEAGALSPRASRGLVIRGEAFREGLVWLAILLSSFVMFEPAPYDLLLIAALALFAFTGLKLPRVLLPFILLVILYQLGAVATLSKVIDRPDTTQWTIVGAFLAATGLFFALYLYEETERRAQLIANAWVISATVGGALAILGYFHLVPFSEELLKYGRAKGTFKDPNVYAPYLIFPALLLIQSLYKSTFRRSLVLMIPLGLILSGIFLSFSRGSWGHLVASAAMMTGLTVLVAPSPGRRARILVTCIVAIGAAVLLVIGLLQIPAVADLMVQRASLEQSYDVGHGGRFTNHTIGWRMVLEQPLGIGIFQFSVVTGSDVHNTYLNGFLSYGWLGGVSLIALTLITLAYGFRYVLAATRWRPMFICVFSTWVVLMIEAAVIDVDHWRHMWALLGMTWGFVAATAAWERRAADATFSRA